MGVVPVITTMVWAWVWASMAAADYGPPPKSPVIIKPAGPSRQYDWVGNGNYAPLHIPKPILIPKWIPQMDPTYTAFWVPQAPSKGGPKGGHKHSHHPGFGPPKGSSVVGHGHDSKASPSYRIVAKSPVSPVVAPPKGPPTLPPLPLDKPVVTSAPAPLGAPVSKASPPAPQVSTVDSVKTADVASNSLAAGESSYSQL